MREKTHLNQTKTLNIIQVGIRCFSSFYVSGLSDQINILEMPPVNQRITTDIYLLFSLDVNNKKTEEIVLFYWKTQLQKPLRILHRIALHVLTLLKNHSPSLSGLDW